MFPSGFLPSNRIFIHSEGQLKLAHPLKVPKDAHFADLNEVLARPLSKEIPADYFNPKVARRQSFNS